MKGNCWIWAWWIYYLVGYECVVMSWRGGFPHFGVEISPGLVMHFRRRRGIAHRRLPLWFDGELVCCKVKGDWAKHPLTCRAIAVELRALVQLACHVGFKLSKNHRPIDDPNKLTLYR